MVVADEGRGANITVPKGAKDPGVRTVGFIITFGVGIHDAISI